MMLSCTHLLPLALLALILILARARAKPKPTARRTRARTNARTNAPAVRLQAMGGALRLHATAQPTEPLLAERRFAQL